MKLDWGRRGATYEVSNFPTKVALVKSGQWGVGRLEPLATLGRVKLGATVKCNLDGVKTATRNSRLSILTTWGLKS